jgi:hypothetical protein
MKWDEMKPLPIRCLQTQKRINAHLDELNFIVVDLFAVKLLCLSIVFMNFPKSHSVAIFSCDFVNPR